MEICTPLIIWVIHEPSSPGKLRLSLRCVCLFIYVRVNGRSDSEISRDSFCRIPWEFFICTFLSDVTACISADASNQILSCYASAKKRCCRNLCGLCSEASCIWLMSLGHCLLLPPSLFSFSFFNAVISSIPLQLPRPVCPPYLFGHVAHPFLFPACSSPEFCCEIFN